MDTLFPLARGLQPLCCQLELRIGIILLNLLIKFQESMWISLWLRLFRVQRSARVTPKQGQLALRQAHPSLSQPTQKSGTVMPQVTPQHSELLQASAPGSSMSLPPKEHLPSS